MYDRSVSCCVFCGKEPMAKRFEELTFRDNFMFEQVMSDAELCREVLEVLLGEPIGKLIPAESEKTIGYIADGKQIRLDLLTKDSGSNTVYDTEMQNRNSHSIEKLALGRRSRYYQSVIDAGLTGKGTDYADLVNSNIVFICTFDPFGQGKYRYTFRSRCDEDPELLLGDGARRIFFNTGSCDPRTPENIKDFFEYIDHGTGNSSLTKKIDASVKAIRAREDLKMGYWSMNAALQDERRFGREEGLFEGKLCTLYSLVRDGVLTKEDAAARLGITPGEFDEAVKAINTEGTT